MKFIENISRNLVEICECGECVAEGNFYTCETCNRSVPYCYGADDDKFDDCNDCWSEWHDSLSCSNPHCTPVENGCVNGLMRVSWCPKLNV